MIDIEDIKQVRLRAGDTVVVQVSGAITPTNRSHIQQLLQSVFPDNKVIVITDQVKFMIVSSESSEEHS
jgi:hypothetical protein